MVRILHITRDYPDEIDADKTSSIRDLVKNTREFRHCIFSLNKTTQPGKQRIAKNEGDVYSVVYLGMPYGLLMQHFLTRVAKLLYELIDREKIKPDLIHCHKLTHEGIIGFYLSQRLGIPLVCSFRGDTDLTVMKLKPNYSAMYTRILEHASCIFFIAPWTRSKMNHRNGKVIGVKATVLPNIVNLNFDNLVYEQTVKNRFVTICRLRDYKRKNIARTIYAIDHCISMGLDVSLDIIGGGPESIMKKIRKDISKCHHSQRFRILGYMEHSEAVSSLSNYAGLILPSYPETFGMVYLEAIHAGIPFIHSRDAGVDGYFLDYEFSIPVNPKCVDSISGGITRLFTNQKTYKLNIKKQMNSGFFKQFNTTRIIKVYENAIERVLEH